ncbi:hypothetical protein [Methanobrevibacter sp.]
MSFKSRMHMYSILFLFVMISLAISPFYLGEPLTNENLATSFLIALVGVAFPLVSFRPEWNKAMLLIEGILFAVIGYTYLINPYNYVFLVFGILLIAISILAYMKKLPPRFLWFFYQSSKKK